MAGMQPHPTIIRPGIRSTNEAETQPPAGTALKSEIWTRWRPLFPALPPFQESSTLRVEIWKNSG
jgi:hypothetical protein